MTLGVTATVTTNTTQQAPEPKAGDVRIRRVVTAIDASGKAFSECHSETFVGGRWFADDPKSLANTGPEADAWRAKYNGAIEAERDQLRLDLAEVGAALAEAESERDTAIAKAESLQSLADQVPGLTAEVERLTALVPAPAGPRQLTRREFSTRFEQCAPGKMRRIWDSDLDIAFSVCMALFTWDGLINLDSELLRQMLGGLAQAGLITADEMHAILGA